MRLISRSDLFLLVGLTAALFTIISRPLGRVLDAAHEIDQDLGLQLLPGLVILAVVFVFHQIRKRHESRAEALAAAADARQATARAAEMERLVGLSQALGQALTHDAIGAATAAHLPAIAEGRPAWVMVWNGVEWRRLAVHGDVPLDACEEAARRATGGPRADDGPDAVCFPMFAAGRPVGVLGVSPNPPVPEHQRAVLAAAAALLGASLKNAELFHEVRETSVRDSLTGCFNRQHALEVMDAELRRARRSRLPLAVIMFDLDHFKAINDQYGHLCGDAVLAGVGQRMKVVLRGSDVKCRWGGEEFLVLLPDTPPAGAQRVAELLRHDLEEHPARWRVGDLQVDIRVTASFGLATVTAGEVDATAILARADAALYRAKSSGRNCVCVAGESVEVTPPGGR
ncbi:MAG: GGDEF domain-containing protein [Acidobacteria bacterium]|nr:GGDEF domain-containing protein [Acidobacteriota bacterium]